MEVILAAVSSIFGTVGNIITSNNAKKISYQEWLNSAIPTYTDVFSNYKTQTDKTNLIIISILAALILILIIAIVVKKNKHEN
jgi:hypothetical protein